MDKICNVCKIEKPLTEFYIRKETGKPRQECKKCVVDRSKVFYSKNKPKVVAYKKEYGKKNRSFISANNKIYKSKPAVRERVNRLAREYNKNNQEKFIERRKKNRAKRNEFMKKYNSNMSKINPTFNIICRLRSRIYQVLKGNVKATTTTEFLGCSIEQFKTYFESLFKDGMSWELFLSGDKMHIDHIVPCSKFNLADPEEQRKCFHYTNLQPLFKLDNLRKGVSLQKLV